MKKMKKVTEYRKGRRNNMKLNEMLREGQKSCAHFFVVKKKIYINFFVRLFHFYCEFNSKNGENEYI